MPAAYGTLGFIENKGQIPSTESNTTVLYYFETPDFNCYVTNHGLTYIFRERISKNAIREDYPDSSTTIKFSRTDMVLKGASIGTSNAYNKNPNTHYYNYLIGSNSENWHENVHSYNEIIFINIYPGIDWVIKTVASEKNKIKYEFIVHPGADYKLIKMFFNGNSKIRLNEEKNFSIVTSLGQITESAPVSFIESTKQQVNSEFVYENEELIFKIDNFSHNQTLVIDPTLTWSTYYGGSSAEVEFDICTDTSGNVYVVGISQSNNFFTLTTGNFYDNTLTFFQDAFITKFDNNGVLLWSTYIGGNASTDIVHSVVADQNNNIFIVGRTASTDFPTFDNTIGYYKAAMSGFDDLVFAKFDNNGAMLWSTYFGGANLWDYPRRLTIDSQGNLFATGKTASNDFPVLNNGTYFDATIGTTGDDAFIVKFDNNGTQLWATYFGGDDGDEGADVAIDSQDNLYLTGNTGSTNFPVQNTTSVGTYYVGAYNNGIDAFISKFTNNGTLLWSTYFGGTGYDVCLGIGIDGLDNLFIEGYTSSTNFPVLSSGYFFDGTNPNNQIKFFFSKFDNIGTMQWSTYYGSNVAMTARNGGEVIAQKVHIDNCNNAYICGITNAPDIPFRDPGCGAYFDNSHLNATATAESFFARFSNKGELTWSTYFFSTTFNDFAGFFAIDKNDNIFYTNQARSNDVTMVNPGSTYHQGNLNGFSDFILAKFSPQPITASVTKNDIHGCVCNGKLLAGPTVCGQTPTNYLWSNGSTTDSLTNLCTGIYSVTITDAACKRDTVNNIIVDSLSVNSPTLSVGTFTNVSCPGGANGIIFLTVSGGNGALNYVWQPVAGTSALASNLTAGTYSCIVTDSLMCRDTILQVLLQPNSFTVTSTSIDDTCNSSIGVASLANVAGGTGPYTYSWLNGSVTVSTSSLSSGVHGYTVTDSKGCTYVNSVTVNNSGSSPSVNAGPDVTITRGSSVQLSAAGASNYNWSPGAGLSCTNCSSPIANPVITTTYVVSIIDVYGCSAYDTLVITVNDSISNLSCSEGLFVPNVFSPNGDGENDELKLFGAASMKILSFIIYDRWGEKVFETTDVKGVWNGFYRDRLCNSAVYTYVFRAVCVVDGSEVFRTGNISLVR